TTITRPRTSSALANTEPMSDVCATTVSPADSAKITMKNSGRLPSDDCRKPVRAGPKRCPTSSVANETSQARPASASPATTNGNTNLWPLVAVLLAAGILRLGFSVARRLVAGRLSLGVEYDLRNRMYAHLQSLEVAFFDEQQTGQLMSRATVDLQAVRFFLGYGLIFIVQSAITILVAAAVM